MEYKKIMIFDGNCKGAEGYFSAPLKYLNIVFVASGDRLSPIRTVDSLFCQQPLNVVVKFVIGFRMISFQNINKLLINNFFQDEI